MLTLISKIFKNHIKENHRNQKWILAVNLHFLVFSALFVQLLSILFSQYNWFQYKSDLVQIVSLFTLPLIALHPVRAPSRNVYHKANHMHIGRFCQDLSVFLFLATLNSQFKIVDAPQRWFWYSPTYVFAIVVSCCDAF